MTTTVYPLIIHVPWQFTIPLLNWHLGPFEITGYGIMLMAGFLVGAWLIGLELERRALYRDYAADVTIGAAIGGILGAKVWYVVANGDFSALFSRGGLVWYGGLLGGAVGVLFNSWRLGIPFRWTMHLAAPALAAAYALGRVGCFIVNDDYGRPTTLPWGVKFPQGLPATTAANLSSKFGIAIPPGTDPNTVLAVHPTQLYEVVIMLGVFALLWKWRTRPKPVGWLFGIYLMLAGTERFLIEFLRAKDDRLFGPLTLAQVTSVGLVALGWYLSRRWATGPDPDPGPYLREGPPDRASEAEDPSAAAKPPKKKKR